MSNSKDQAPQTSSGETSASSATAHDEFAAADWAGGRPAPLHAARPPERRGPKGYRRSDERIREDICERLLYDPEIDSSEVTVEVSGGKVVLEGSVTERRMKHAIEDVAAACRGVVDIENRIKVLRPAWQAGPPFLY
jgi:osmotically-inducible protein OsmY